LILFLFTTAINLVTTWHDIPVQCVNTATVILQVGTVNLIVFISGPSHLSYLGIKIEVNQVW
jgi:hypothetical protein